MNGGERRNKKRGKYDFLENYYNMNHTINKTKFKELKSGSVN